MSFHTGTSRKVPPRDESTAEDHDSSDDRSSRESIDEGVLDDVHQRGPGTLRQARSHRKPPAHGLFHHALELRWQAKTPVSVEDLCAVDTQEDRAHDGNSESAAELTRGVVDRCTRARLLGGGGLP